MEETGGGLEGLGVITEAERSKDLDGNVSDKKPGGGDVFIERRRVPIRRVRS